MYSIGYDVGSSSVKGALIEIDSGIAIASCKYPEEELLINSPKRGWAEQNPNTWWTCIIEVTRQLLDQTRIDSNRVASIGIAYQMHGLVLIDNKGEVVRPCIIWCDSRAVAIGEEVLAGIGESYAFQSLLNSPGNFTVSKLKWVQENEPAIYKQVEKLMLPGDYINFKLSGDINTTISGLSEGIFWDFEQNKVSKKLLDYLKIDCSIIPSVVPNVGLQSRLSDRAANELGLSSGTPIAYRAGDQPNNALALNVMKPGEIAATAGTSGVVYAVTDQLVADKLNRVNSFAHVNHSLRNTQIGVLLCLNGTGIQYSWLRKILGGNLSYTELEELSNEAPIGSKGCMVFPFGNGAERIFENRMLNASIQNIDFNHHSKSDIIRATLEGIANSFIYGIEILQSLNIDISTLKVGNDNLFQSKIFREHMANVLQIEIQIMEVNGAIGAAKGAAVGAHLKESLAAFGSSNILETIIPGGNTEDHKMAYHSWKDHLNKKII